MALDEHGARVGAAQQLHEAAAQRARELYEVAYAARQKAAEIAAHSDGMLEAVAQSQGEATDDELLENADKARRASAIADIAEAKAVAAARAKEQAQIALLRAQADALTAQYQRSVDRELLIADEIDDVLAHLGDLCATYTEQTKATAVAFSACHSHNTHELNPNHHHNATLAGLPPDKQPRANIPQHPGSLPMVRCELYMPNSSRGPRTVITALLPRLRQSHGRPLWKAEAA